MDSYNFILKIIILSLVLHLGNMIFHQENQRFQSTSLVFTNHILHFDHKKASLKSSKWQLERMHGGELIDLSYLLKR